jgi:predicted alpha/beta-fold hydrolase
VRDNPWIRVIMTPHGGHCAFLDPAGPQYDGYWAERAAVEFALENVRSVGTGVPAADAVAERRS